MEKNYDAYFKRIESWQDDEIEAVLNEAKENKELEEALYRRYNSILKRKKKSTLSFLISLPQTLESEAEIIERNLKWEPDAQTIEILRTIPVDKIAVYSYVPMFPKWITYIEKLRVIHFLCINIDAIPEEIRRLKNLEELTLGIHFTKSFYGIEKKMTTLPQWLTELSLKEISISTSALDQIPLFITEMQDLECLGFSNNEIKEIPDEIGRLKHLRLVYLEGNRINNLPTSILELEKLEFLEIGLLKKYLCDDEIPKFMQTYILNREGDPIIPYYRMLESKNEIDVKQAVDELQTRPYLLRRVEKRYLPYIKAMLKDTEATLYDLNKVIINDDKLALIEKVVRNNKIVWGDDLENMYNLLFLDEQQATFILDMMGAMVQSSVSVEEYIKDASRSKNEEILMQRANFHLDRIYEYITKEALRYTEGWFGRAYALFAWNNPQNVSLKSIAFYKGIPTLLRGEFYMYLAAFNREEITRLNRAVKVKSIN